MISFCENLKYISNLISLDISCIKIIIYLYNKIRDEGVKELCKSFIYIPNLILLNIKC